MPKTPEDLRTTAAEPLMPAPETVPGVQVPVRVGQILRETKWMKNHEEPFIHYTRIDAIVPDSGNQVFICGPGATTPEGTAIHLQIFGTVSPGVGASVEETITDEWGGRTVRDVISLHQLPKRYIWADAIRKDYAGLGPEKGKKKPLFSRILNAVTRGK